VARRFVTACGRMFRNTDATYFPAVSYKRRMLRLCTDACLRAFEANPKCFMDKHRRHGDAPSAYRDKA
jgi:hypothetical protein